MTDNERIALPPYPLPPLHTKGSGCIYDDQGRVVAAVTVGTGWEGESTGGKLAQDRAAAIATACNEAAALKRRIAELEAERAELHKCLRGIATKPTTFESANEDEAHGYRDFRGAYNIMIREARRVMKEKL